MHTQHSTAWAATLKCLSRQSKAACKDQGWGGWVGGKGGGSDLGAVIGKSCLMQGRLREVYALNLGVVDAIYLRSAQQTCWVLTPVSRNCVKGHESEP